MPTFQRVDSFYQPEDFNYHLYLSKKKKLVDPTERNETLRCLIKAMVRDDGSLEYVVGAIDSKCPKDGGSFESNHIEDLRSCLVELKKHDSVDEPLSAKFDRFIFELDVCLELMKNPNAAATVGTLGEAEQAMLKNQYLIVLENEYQAAMDRIDAAEKKIPADFGTVVNALDRVELQAFYRDARISVKSAHKNNVGELNDKNYIGECIILASTEQSALKGELVTYWGGRSKIDSKYALFGSYSNAVTEVLAPFLSSCFGGFSKSAKGNAASALVRALAGKQVDLRPHLSALNQGNLGDVIKRQVTVGNMDGFVGQHCSTVDEFFEALAETQKNNFSRNLASVAPGPSKR